VRKSLYIVTGDLDARMFRSRCIFANSSLVFDETFIVVASDWKQSNTVDFDQRELAYRRISDQYSSCYWYY